MTGKDLEVWTAQSLCDIGIALSIATFGLHLARPYFERTVRQLQAKMAEEMWWVTYLLVRDGALLGSILLGFLMLNPDLMADIKIAVPWVPFATVFMVGAAVVKLSGERVAAERGHRVVTLLLGVAAFLNTIGYTFVMEAPGGEYAHTKSAFWQAMRSMRSNANPDLSIWSFYLSFPLLVVLVLVLWSSVMRRRESLEENVLVRKRGV